MSTKPPAKPALNKAAPKPRKTRKRSGRNDYNAPIQDEVLAMVWTLTEEGLSQRGVGKRLEISPSVVGRELAGDPLRLEAIRARQREERSARWRKIEDLGLDEVLGWLDRVKLIREGKKRLSQRAMVEMPLLPRFLQSCRATAETATKQVQLLTGGVTERLGTANETQADELTVEQLIEQAIELDAVGMLPPRLRAAAEAEIKRRQS